MKRLIFGLTVVVGTMLGILSITQPAAAQVVCDQNACQAAGQAANAPAYHGPVAPTTDAMACVRIVTYGRSEVIWVAGNEQNYTFAPVITSQRRAAGVVRQFELHSGWVVVESCIPQSWLQNVYEITICNGSVPGQGYHWQLTADEVARLKGRPGHPTSYVPLLADADIMSLSVQQVRAAYQQRYGY